MCTVECKTVHPPLLLTGGGGYDLYDLKKKNQKKTRQKIFNCPALVACHVASDSVWSFFSDFYHQQGLASCCSLGVFYLLQDLLKTLETAMCKIPRKSTVSEILNQDSLAQKTHHFFFFFYFRFLIFDMKLN